MQLVCLPPCKTGSSFVHLRTGLEPSSVPGSTSFKALSSPSSAPVPRVYPVPSDATSRLPASLPSFLLFLGYYGKRWKRTRRQAAMSCCYSQVHLKACKHALAFRIITHLYVLSFAISFISPILNVIIQTGWAQAFCTCSTINKQKRLNTICNMSSPNHS